MGVIPVRARLGVLSSTTERGPRLLGVAVFAVFAAVFAASIAGAGVSDGSAGGPSARVDLVFMLAKLRSARTEGGLTALSNTNIIL